MSVTPLPPACSSPSSPAPDGPRPDTAAAAPAPSATAAPARATTVTAGSVTPGSVTAGSSPGSAAPHGAGAVRGDDLTTAAGHRYGSRDYHRVIVALACAGVATFGQLYSPQAALPAIARGLGVPADGAGLVVSAATIGVGVGVLPWAQVAGRLGSVRAMKVSLAVSTLLGMALPLCGTVPAMVAVRFVQGLVLAALPALAVAYLHEEIHPTATARAAGAYVGGTATGGLAGRLVAGVVAGLLGWRLGMGAVSLVSLAATVGFFVAVPAPLAPSRAARGGPGTGALRTLGLVLRRGDLRVLFVQGFLFMGSFVAFFNYLGFRLEAAPYHLSPTLVSLLFVAYLGGSVASRRAGAAVQRLGRARVAGVAAGAMVAGTALSLAAPLPVVLVGLVLFTAGFFGGHAVVSGWVGHRAHGYRAHAASLYTLSFYLGASLVGWFGGVLFERWGWSATAGAVLLLSTAALALTVHQRSWETGDGDGDGTTGAA